MAHLAASRPGLVVSIAALLIAAHSSSAQAAWPHDPYLGNVALCTAAGDQDSVASVSDGSGGAIIAWSDARSGNRDIYARRVSASGVPLWTADGVALCTATGDQRRPVIVSDGAGGAIVTWQDLRGGAYYDIYAQRVNAAGALQWAANGVAICAATNEQTFPTIATDGANGAIVTWRDHRNGANEDIYARRVNAAGVPQWVANGVAICTSAGNQLNPTIASDGSGGAFVTWFDFRSGADYDIYAQRVNSLGAPQWTANGIGVCVLAANQDDSKIVSDGAGGAIVTWADLRSTADYDIYAQRVNGAGAAYWPANGVALCTALNHQVAPAIASDGAGGAIVAWYDYRSSYANADIYARRVSAGGEVMWTTDGVALCTAAEHQYYVEIASDGFGGAIATWQDYRGGYPDIYAQRVSAAGAPRWAASGVALCAAGGTQSLPTVAPDGEGGAIVAWSDLRSLANYDIYVQRVSPFGYLGNPEPSITSARDVPNDQGGKLKLVWSQSYVDATPSNPISNYWVWRSVPPNVAAEALARGARLIAEGERADPSPDRRMIKISHTSANSYSWEYVGLEAAHGFPSYSYVVSTTSDSLGGNNPFTAFLVEAQASGNVFIDSAPDSGYSVDNISPATPAPFTAAYSFGATHLHWGPNHETDLAGYRLYRGSSADFIPRPGFLISAQPDTGFADVGPAGSWYKLSAVDIHGNESVYAVLGPDNTLDAPGRPVGALAFSAPAPNPARSGGTTFRFTLPADARVTLSLFDQQGRRVCNLARGPFPPGNHEKRWDGRDNSGRQVPSGIYFARFEAMGRTMQVRFALVK
jgi:hypothetical protein